MGECGHQLESKVFIADLFLWEISYFPYTYAFQILLNLEWQLQDRDRKNLKSELLLP